MFDVLETVKSYREPLSSLATLKLRSMSDMAIFQQLPKGNVEARFRII